MEQEPERHFIKITIPEPGYPGPKLGSPCSGYWLYAHAPFSPTFLMDFCLDGPSECTGQI